MEILVAYLTGPEDQGGVTSEKHLLNSVGVGEAFLDPWRAGSQETVLTKLLPKQEISTDL